MTCPICCSIDITVAKIEHPFFIQTDYSMVKPSARIGECVSCRSLFQCADGDDILRIRNLFADEAYAHSNQTSQTFTVNEFDRPVTRSFLQSELLRPVVQKETPIVLDIGCFDGELLQELNDRLVGAELHGFDNSEHLRALFPAKDNFHFWTGDLASIDGEYDLICMSHSMAYIQDVSSLMRHITRLMKPDGLLFLQMPDISSNPCWLLMADQFYYYTPAIVKNIVGHFGFGFSLIENRWFPREIVGLGRFGIQKKADYVSEYGLRECISELSGKARRLKEIAETFVEVGVLGTTASAAFVDSVISDRVSRFLDENPNRIDTLFRGKAVLHPRVLKDPDVVVIPYGQSGQAIQQRFASRYQGRFIVV